MEECVAKKSQEEDHSLWATTENKQATQRQQHELTSRHRTTTEDEL